MSAAPTGTVSSYVRLRGLPFTATEQEVAQWFAAAPGAPIQVHRVLFTYNTTGRKSGEAYVELPELMAERAVQVLNHRNLGSRYVEVFLSSEGEMSQANVAPPVANNGAGWQMEPGGAGGIVRLRGLPFNATQDLILQFFTGYEIPKGPMGVHLLLGANGRPNGESFVEFGSEEIADAALQKDRATIGTRYVEVFRSTPEQMSQALLRVAKSNNLAPMHLQQQQMAAAHQQQMQSPYAQYSPYGMQAPMMGAVMPGPGGAEAVVKMRGLPYKITRNDILEFFNGLSVPLNGVHLMYNEREQPTGEAYVEFSSPEDRERAMLKDRQHIGGRYVELFRVGRSEFHASLEQFVGAYMSNQMAMPGAAANVYANGMYGAMQQSPYAQPPYAPSGYPNMQQHMVSPQQGVASGMGGGGQKMAPGTLRMRGIPFRSTVDDVVRFFAGFQIVPGGVVLGQRDGRATGDCYVTFTSPAESQRAMVMNNKHMGSRYVELFNA